MIEKKRQPVQRRAMERLLFANAFRDAREPCLALGDLVCLNTGGPVAMVVDRLLNGRLVVARRISGRVEEYEVDESYIHRARNVW